MKNITRFLSALTALCLILSLSAAFCVGAENIHYPETLHPYEPLLDDEGEPWIYEGEGAKDVKALRITFSEDTETEPGFDVIRLYGSKGQQVGEYSGKELAGRSVITPGISFYISLTTDAENQAYGYRIVSVEPLFAVQYTFVSNGGSPVGTISDATVDKSPRTEKEGMYFAGWYDNPSLSGEQISFPFRSDADITLYAAWSDVPATNLNDFSYEILENGTVTITEYTGYDSTVYIPAEAEGLPVTGLGSSVFAQTPVKSVVIGKGITSVDAYAFEGAPDLQDITVSPDNPAYTSENGVLFTKNMKTLLRVPAGFSGTYIIPESTTTIGTNAFTSCKQLTGVTFSKNIKAIPDNAFLACSGITKFTVPAGITSIGEGAFKSCTKLDSVSISDSVTKIGKDAFAYTALYKNSSSWENGVLYADNYAVASTAVDTPKNLVLKDGTRGVADYSFSKNTSLLTVTLPESTRFIGSYAFLSCTALTSADLPEGITSIGDYAFSKCTSLTSVTLPDSLTAVGKMGIFDGDTALTSAVIGKGLKSLCTNMFKGCSKLKTVTLTNSTTDVAKNAFSGCTALTDVTYKGSAAQWSRMSVKPDGNSTFTGADITFDLSDVWSKGDLNHDGKANGVDGSMIKEFILGDRIPTENEFYAADVNSDGKINSVDGNRIREIIVGNIPFINAWEQ